MVKALYVHIPFCSHKCPYCDFVSLTGGSEDMPEYTQLVEREALLLAREAGFENINVDLIYGYPGQRAEDLLEELEWIEKLRPAHVSAYLLTPHRETPLWLRLGRGEISLPSEDEIDCIYRTLWTGLKALGYERYEISNWALPGRRCEHNLAYWNMEEFLGMGVSAWGFLQNRRYGNLRNITAYRKALLSGKRPIEREIHLSGEELAEEFLMLRLRLKRGLPLSYRHLIPDHLLTFFEEESDGIGIKEEYMLLADEIIGEVLLYNSHRQHPEVRNGKDILR